MNTPPWDPQRWARVTELFQEALELAPERRATFVQQLQADAPDIAQAVSNMLAADAAFSTDTPPNAVSALTDAFDTELPAGTRLGAYAIESCLGTGGMGRVYRAHRVEGDVAQTVAIKCLRFRSRDPEFTRRFLRERRILAQLTHPNIARFLDVGTDPDGQPFVVIEYVDGLSITEFACTQRLSLRARIELLLKVMGAVAYSHRQLIVHRDIKPGNVLVAANGEPQLLDFGIAKQLMPDDLTPVDGETALEHRAFSLGHAAPEQLQGAAVGTACDIYALGVLAYELICAQPPLALAGVPFAEAQRQVLEVFPAPPSERLRNEAAAPDGSSTAVWQRALRGDLDNIVLHALKKEPNERYPTVDAFIDDLRRYLDDEAISLRSGHRWYRAQMFVRRNRIAVAAGLLVALSLVAGIVAFAWQARIAQQRAAELEQVSQFQANMLGQVDPTQAGLLLTQDVNAKFADALTKAGVPEAERNAQTADFAAQWRRVNATDTARDLIDRTILKPAVAAIDLQFKDQPIVDATLSQALAHLYTELALYESALSLQERALGIRRRVLGNEHPDTLASIDSMAELMQDQGELDKAEPYDREATEARRRVLGAEHPDTLVSLDHMGTLLMGQGKLDEAEPYYREALEKRRRTLGDDHLDTLSSSNNLGVLLWEQGKLVETEVHMREVLEKRTRLLGRDHPKTLISINNLGALLKDQGKPGEAEPYLRETLQRRRHLLGEEHPETLVSINLMGTLFRDWGKLSDAEPFYREALDGRRRVLGDEHPETLYSMTNLATLLELQGKLAEAEPYAREAYTSFRRVVGDESPFTLVSITNLGSVLQAQGRYAEAVELLTSAEGTAREVFTGASLRRLARLLMSLGKARMGLREFATAESNLAEAHRLFIASPGTNPGEVRMCVQAIFDFYLAWHQTEPSKGYDAKAAEWKRKLDELRTASTALVTTQPPPTNR